jgi:myosin heavy subunit
MIVQGGTRLIISNVLVGEPNPPPAVQHQAQSQSQHVDLLGLNSDFTGIPASANTAPTPQPQFNDTNNTDFLQRTHSTLLSNTTSELTRAQNAQSQFLTESQAIQELQRQIDQQKEVLAKMKQEADEAERQLEVERKRKEELFKELQMYKQEAKHFATRIENAQEETAKLRQENATLEKEKQNSPPPPSATAALDPAHDFFSLSSAPSTNSNGLFAKVTEPVTASSTISSPQQSNNTFDPFAGFKAQQQQSSPVVSINKLKEETELKRTVTSNVDISDIESKFPDLNTMEQSFASPTSPPPPPSASVSSPAPTPAAASTSTPLVQSPSSPKTNDLYSNLFASPTAASPSLQRSTTSAVKSDHSSSNSLARSVTSAVKKDPKSKYGFDLSAFETSSSSTPTPFGGSSITSMKDELSSLFGSPTTNTASLPKSTTGFDDIFGNTTATNNNKPNSFEDIFSQK